VWRHAVNGFMRSGAEESGFLVLGPLRGGGELVEIGWVAEVGESVTARYAWAITGSPAPTLANLRGGTSLIQRSSETGGLFGVPTVELRLTSAQYFGVALPMSVRLETGGQYLVVGINVGGEAQQLMTLAWALAIGGPGSAGYKRPMVNGQGLGVEDGLDR